MGNIFITSDTHFFHKNAIKLSNRPFSCIEEMNEILIDNWNETVTNNDTIYHLGDFMMGISLKHYDKSFQKLKDTVGRLRGRIRLITGNHDKTIIKLCAKMNECPFEWIKGSDFIRSNNRKIHLTHKPSKRDFLFHGHSHGTVAPRNFIRLDVGVDCWDYTPISLELAMSRLKALEYKKHYH